MFDQERANIVPFGRFHANLAEHPLECQFHDSLGFADHIGESASIQQELEKPQTQASLDQITLGQCHVGHISNTSPNR